MLDATVGQNGVTQAREFMDAAGVNGIVLTKLDGTAKGGVAVAIAHDLKLPIRYVGVGEGIDDLVPFSADEYVDGSVRGEVVTELDYMDRALFLAARGRGRTSPNPMVGAVVVSPDGVIVGQGFHERAGSRTRRCRRSAWPARARAGRRCTARSSRAAIRDAPVRARRASSKPASRASWRRPSIRIRSSMAAASAICARRAWTSRSAWASRRPFA